MDTKQRWQDWLNLLLGIWLVVAPLIGIGAMGGLAAWNAYLFGAIIIVFSVAALNEPHGWEEWTNLVVGLWLIAAPFALGFSAQVGPTWNHIGVGAVVAADALLVALRRGRSVQPPHHA